MRIGFAGSIGGCRRADEGAKNITTTRRGPARFFSALFVAGFTMAAALMVAQPSQASLYDGVYEDSARLAALETASGQYNAGVSLLRTVQNYSGAARWFRRAADQGHANAQAVLGSLYAVGLGVPKNFVNAYVWVTLALPRLEGRMRDRAEALQEELSALMSPAEIGEAKKIAGEWRTTAR